MSKASDLMVSDADGAASLISQEQGAVPGRLWCCFACVSIAGAGGSRS